VVPPRQVEIAGAAEGGAGAPSLLTVLAATLRDVGLGERLRSVDERLMTGRVRTPAPWSPAVGPLVPLAEQLQQGRLLGGVVTLVGVVAAVVTGLLGGVHPTGLAGAGVTFVLASGLFALIVANTSRQRALLAAARAVPGQVPVRATLPSAVAVVVAVLVGVLLGGFTGWTLTGPAGSAMPLGMALGWAVGLARQRAELIAWQDVHGELVLARRRSAAWRLRGGLYRVPARGRAAS
jgi:hypothetical protein